jgi:hypothetical protein
MIEGSITLITPPDIFENSNISILLAHLTEEEQDAATDWLSNTTFSQDLNIYFYNGEPDVTWFLYALNRCDYKYINIDYVNYITQALSGYALGKSNTCYSTADANLTQVYSHINSKKVTNVKEFLEGILGDQTNTN